METPRLTSPHLTGHVWAVVVALVAGGLSTLWEVVASNEFLSESSDQVFPGKATWGFVKDVSEPISFSAGTLDRSQRSVRATAPKGGGGEVEVEVETQAPRETRWMRNSLPLVQDDEGTIVSASISISDRGSGYGNRGYQGGENPTTGLSRPFGSNWWMGTRTRSGFPTRQINFGRNIMKKNYQIFRAGLLGDSPVVYTGRLPERRTWTSSKVIRSHPTQMEKSLVSEMKERESTSVQHESKFLEEMEEERLNNSSSQSSVSGNEHHAMNKSVSTDERRS